MNLTFKGFMRSYCRELTGLETDNLRKLCAAAALNAPQAAEAIMVFAALQGKANYLAEIASNTWMHAQYQEIVQELLHYDTVDAFLESESAPERYKKVSKAYQAAKTTAAKDRRVIALMRKKTLEAMRHNGASIYSLGKTLGINKGNLYAYLSKGDVTKVSRTTARRIMDYACGL